MVCEKAAEVRRQGVVVGLQCGERGGEGGLAVREGVVVGQQSLAPPYQLDISGDVDVEPVLLQVVNGEDRACCTLPPGPISPPPGCLSAL